MLPSKRPGLPGERPGPRIVCPPRRMPLVRLTDETAQVTCAAGPPGSARYVRQSRAQIFQLLSRVLRPRHGIQPRRSKVCQQPLPPDLLQRRLLRPARRSPPCFHRSCYRAHQRQRPTRAPASTAQPTEPMPRDSHRPEHFLALSRRSCLSASLKHSLASRIADGPARSGQPVSSCRLPRGLQSRVEAA